MTTMSNPKIKPANAAVREMPKRLADWLVVCIKKRFGFLR
jgi:hypothetical protein